VLQLVLVSFKNFKCFGSDAATIGVFKTTYRRTNSSPGWYNSAAFEKEAHKAGLYAKSVNGDAFSDEVKGKL
jgi:enoyl-[acyl-carrier protein] reductase/trans-2-enoyl-CoA reductase (NAD+)